jgi:hypothetical protein
MKEVNIELKEYSYDCPDGCCTQYNTQIIVDGTELDNSFDDVDTVLKYVLEHLGYKVNITRTNE